MINRTIKIQKKKFIITAYYFFVFFVIYSTDSLAVELGLFNTLRDISYLMILFFGVLFLFIMLVKYHGKARGTDACWLLVLIISIFLSSLMNFDKTFVGPLKISCLIIGYYIAKELDTDLFISIFVKVMLIISLFSIVSFLLRPVLLNFRFFPTIIGYKNQVFQIQFLSNTRIYPNTYRNWGPFWEPGAYQTYLIIALLLLFFCSPEIKHKKSMITVFVITLISTFSTTGFIAFPFIFFAYLLDTKDSNKNSIWKLLFITAILAVVVWFLNSEYYSDVFENKFDENTINHRAVTVQYGIQLFLKKPLFGFSSKYTEVLYDAAGFQFGVTNFFAANAVCFGFWVGLYSIIGLISCVKSFKRPFIVSILALAGLVLSLCGEKFLYSPMICFLLFYRKTSTEKYHR